MTTELSPPPTHAREGEPEAWLRWNGARPAGGTAPPPVIRIEPPPRFPTIDLAELWRYRDLLFQMVWRNISARYRQSVIGIGWAVIRPLVTMVVFTFVFGRVAGLPSAGIPYMLISLTGLLPWTLFSACLGQSGASLVGGSALITKVYFPRLVLPLSAVAVGLVDFGIQLVLLVVILGGYALSGRFVPEVGWELALLPAFVLMAAVAGLAIGLWAAALNVKYRDIGQALPFVTQIWMWLSPVAYLGEAAISVLPEPLRPLYGLNPMAGVIDGFRWVTVGGPAPNPVMFAVSAAAVAVLMVGGLFFFRSVERQFADIV